LTRDIKKIITNMSTIIQTNLIKFMKGEYVIKLNDVEYDLNSILTKWSDDDLFNDYNVFYIIFPKGGNKYTVKPNYSLSITSQEEAKIIANDPVIRISREKIFNRILEHFDLMYNKETNQIINVSEEQIPGLNAVQLPPVWIDNKNALYRWIIILKHLKLMISLEKGDGGYSRKINQAILLFFCKWFKFLLSYENGRINSYIINIYKQLFETQDFMQRLSPFINYNIVSQVHTIKGSNNLPQLQFNPPVITVKEVNSLDYMKMNLNDRVKIKDLSNYDPLLDKLFISYSNLNIQALMIVNNKGRNFFTDLKDFNYIKDKMTDEVNSLMK
jgi:hypothetical protein